MNHHDQSKLGKKVYLTYTSILPFIIREGTETGQKLESRIVGAEAMEGTAYWLAPRGLAQLLLFVQPRTSTLGMVSHYK